MKIERIDDNKIKVFLTLDDLAERDIDLSSLSYNSPQAQKLFVDMMHLAEDEHDFFVDDSQILIEAVPVPPEGFEVIVTKVNEESEFESINKYIKNRLKRVDLSSKRRNKKLSTNVFVYQFSSFENLCSGIEHIDSEYPGEGTVYKYKSDFYLVFPKRESNEFQFNSIEITLNEFGEKVSDSAFFEGFLDEHGEKMIPENAIEIIRSYF